MDSPFEYVAMDIALDAFQRDMSADDDYAPSAAAVTIS
jgi:hypothetical protein